MKNRYCIERIRLFWGQMPVRVSFSYGTEKHFNFMLVCLGAGAAEGIGEVLVPPNDFIRHFLPSLLGRDARRLDALLPETSNDYELIVCEAVSMALYDLVGRISNLPLHVLLGGAGEDRVPLMPCIFPNSAEEAKERAQFFFSQGYRHLKTKLTGNLEEDRARVQAIRSVAPLHAVLQGDANEGYKTLPEACQAVDELGAAGLDFFEDPLKGGVEDYRVLRARCHGAKIMVDVLARRTEDLLAVLRAGAADAINIHPDQAGSLSRVVQHAMLARSFGTPVIIGGTGYTAVGTAAYQHLTAVATPGGICGELGGVLDHDMPNSLVKQSLQMRDGAVILPDRPGTGVEIDEEALVERIKGQQKWSR